MKSLACRLSVAATLVLLILTMDLWLSAGQVAPNSAQANEAQMPASGEITVQPAKTFSGRIVKENGELVLLDPVTKVSHKVSDQSKVKKYLDQQVKITGKLDKNTNTIQLKSVEPQP